ncbi:MAG: tetratricopeptide repeat protein, partial [Acidobacteriota bacterium]
PVVRAEVLSLLGSLRMDQTRYDEAEEILQQAAKIYERHGSRLQAGRTLMKLGKLMGEAGETDRSLGFLRRAREVFGEDEPRLRLLTGHTLVVTLNDAGRLDEALELFGSLQEEYDLHGRDFSMSQRRRWVEARLLQAGDDPEGAETAFREVRDAFAEREVAYDFALVSLELAALLLSQKRTREVRELAEELLPIFTSRQIHRHALASLALFQNAAVAERATSELVRELIRYLQRARNNPYLPFSFPDSTRSTAPGPTA